jgi:uncharacterized protein with von Willebrand factor type A (vWA) domain
MIADDDLLREIAYGKERYLPDLIQKARENKDSALHREAAAYAARRLGENKPRQEIDGAPESEETDEDSEGDFQSQDRQGPQKAPGAPKTENEKITEQDVSNLLGEYQKKGDLDVQKGKVIVTPKGVNKLASGALQRILQNIRRTRAGPHPIEKEDFGMEPSPHTRKYEVGDDYAEVDMECTSLNALSRCGKLQFETEDFEIREQINRSKLCAAIIIDESGSMRDSGKLQAAMETALALSKLILRDPENSLKIFVFSDEVKQIQPIDIVNDVILGGDTDIRKALSAFRRASRNEFGDKQAYLITDTEPNNQDGKHIPFTKAAAGLVEEASRYRQEKIGLNVIMLSQLTELRSLASTIAKRNLGRVFFTSPLNLGEILVEDYLKNRAG